MLEVRVPVIDEDLVSAEKLDMCADEILEHFVIIHPNYAGCAQRLSSVVES
jgi:hypothetical protein